MAVTMYGSMSPSSEPTVRTTNKSTELTEAAVEETAETSSLIDDSDSDDDKSIIINRKADVVLVISKKQINKFLLIALAAVCCVPFIIGIVGGDDFFYQDPQLRSMLESYTQCNWRCIRRKLRQATMKAQTSTSYLQQLAILEPVEEEPAGLPIEGMKRRFEDKNVLALHRFDTGDGRHASSPPPGCEVTVQIIRHCEKDVLVHHCDYMGFERAKFLTTIYGDSKDARWPVPSYIYALDGNRYKVRGKHVSFKKKVVREVETVLPCKCI